MWQGEQFWYVSEQGILRSLPTALGKGSGRPSHRVRQKFNFIHSLVESKVSTATQKIPSYEVIASTTEPQDYEAAALSEKVLIYGYEKWNLRRATTEAVTTALVQREAFAYPYWDTNVGPFMEDIDEETGEVKTIGQGEVKVPIFSAEAVYWEPGQSFDESRWHAIDKAMYIGDVYDLPNYNGGELTPDASTKDNPTDRDRESEELVLVTEYLERPSLKNRKGHRILIANGKQIIPSESFPVKDHEGNIVDEPALIRLSYVVDPTQDRDRGLVDLLIDPQRTINDTWGKILEWKNRCLNPQMIAPINSLVAPPTDVPGAIVYYRPTGQSPPQWQQTPPIPGELFQILQESITEMRVIAADIDVQAEPDLAARTAMAAIEQSQARWASFLGDVATYHQKVGRRCLWLVQQHYTEPRLITIQGTWGTDLIDSFLGANLNGQADVRVNPSTLESRSRTAITQEAMAFAERGWISGAQAMASINGGVAESLAQSWTLDVGRINRIIQAIKQGNYMEVFPPHTQKVPLTDELGQPIPGPDGMPQMTEVQVPGWMPRAGVDKLEVWMEVMAGWQKTADWDRLNDEQRGAGEMIFQALQQIQADEQQTAMIAQNMEAQALGAENASHSSKPKAMPDRPNMDGPPAQEQLAT